MRRIRYKGVTRVMVSSRGAPPVASRASAGKSMTHGREQDGTKRNKKKLFVHLQVQGHNHGFDVVHGLLEQQRVSPRCPEQS